MFGILFPKLFWPTVRKSDQEKLSRTIYSNIEMSEQILVTECFLNLSGGFSDLISQNSNWKKILGFRNIQEELENTFAYFQKKLLAEVSTFQYLIFMLIKYLGLEKDKTITHTLHWM